jgi:hypothetical protein
VPCPPESTALPHEHLTLFGTDADGRLFYGEQGGELPNITVARIWLQARQDAFTPEVLATPLAETPYALRHTAVSTWLNGGVPATQVAEWAGHSVEVLLKVYAKCLAGQDALAVVGWRRHYVRSDRPRRCGRNRRWNFGTYSARTVGSGREQPTLWKVGPDRRFRWSGPISPGERRVPPTGIEPATHGLGMSASGRHIGLSSAYGGVECGILSR